MEVLGAPCSLAEVVALRAGRYVPLFGHGPCREEVVRALANLSRVLGLEADPRGAEHALVLALHTQLGGEPLRALVRAVSEGRAAPCWIDTVLGYVQVLGAGDALRERVAREMTTAGHRDLEVTLALGVGGGDYGTFREHYAVLTSEGGNEPAVRVARAWFDFVLARRFQGLDILRGLGADVDLDGASRWLIATAEFVAGDESARERMAELADSVLLPLRSIVPRLTAIVAREMAEMVQHPLALRFHHLRCAAVRDHAAVAMRAWLTAATEPEGDDAGTESLGPEPTRAGRAAIEQRAAAGEFLLDWFVPDQEAREAVDAFARQVLKVYHRLRGAQTLVRLEREVRPSGGALTRIERLVWGGD